MILAEAIRRIHNGESMAYLFRNIAVDDWGNAHYIYIDAHAKQTLPCTQTLTKNQVDCNLQFNMFFLFVLMINMLTCLHVEIGCIYCIWSNSNSQTALFLWLLYKQDKMLHFTNIWFLPSENINSSTIMYHVLPFTSLQNLINKTNLFGWVNLSFFLNHVDLKWQMLWYIWITKWMSPYHSWH